MTPHRCTGTSDCFGCRIKTVKVQPLSATPSRANTKPPTVSEGANAWERGTVTDSRGMPLLDAKGVTMGPKQYAEGGRRAHEEARRARAAGMTV